MRSIPFMTFVVLSVSLRVYSAPIQEIGDPSSTTTVGSPGFFDQPHLNLPLGPGIALPPKLPKIHLGPGPVVPQVKGPLVHPTFTPVSDTSSSASPAATPGLGGFGSSYSGPSDDGPSNVDTRELMERGYTSFEKRKFFGFGSSSSKPPSTSSSSRPGLFSSLLPLASSFLPSILGSTSSTSTNPGTSTDPSTTTDTAAAPVDTAAAAAPADNAAASSTDTAAAPADTSVGTDASPADNSGVQPLEA